MYYRLQIISCIMLFTACVSPKLVEEMKEQQNKLVNENKTLKEANLNAITENTELTDQVSRLENTINDLVHDSVQRRDRIDALLDSYSNLNDTYDLLLTNNNKMIASKAKEIKNILEELQLAKEGLHLKEDELQTLEDNLSVQQKELIETQKELERREQTVLELESVINRKDSLVRVLKKRISNALLGFEGDGLTITQKNGKVYVSLEEQLLFKSGSWEVDSRGQEALAKLSKVLENQAEINVMIEGHTDSIPFAGRGQVKDNWDLSVVRATSIVRILTGSSDILESQLTAAGRGEFNPIWGNSTEEGRAANRRIEIILSPKLDDLYKILD